MSAMHKVMQMLGRLMPQDPGGERVTAVRMIRRMEVVRDWLRGGPLRRGASKLAGGSGWPPVFQPGQGLLALFGRGVTAERRINGALGHLPVLEIRARTAEGILQSIVRHGLVSQLDHAGYLGVELAKAEAALRFGLRYEQDQHLRRESD